MSFNEQPVNGLFVTSHVDFIKFLGKLRGKSKMGKPGTSPDHLLTGGSGRQAKD